MNTHKILSTAISKSLPKPLAYLQTQIADNIQALVQYSPTIGLMGKTGAGKSSLINALFQSNVSTVNHVERGTTQAIPLQMALRKRTLTFVDFPGIGEPCERAWTADEITYQFLVRDCGYDPKRFLFILNQADKIEPCREWDSQQQQPSIQQWQHLALKRQAVMKTFSPHHPVMALSAKEGYQLHSFVETMIQALPAQATSLTFTQLKSPYRTETVKQQVQQDFSHCVNTTVDTLINQLPLPIDLKTAFIRVKDYLVSAVVSLWRWLF
uniref:50S ribosome-binding GTPase n=1 Tax=Providencia stuartii TaxID=588 RepID=A0AAI9GJ05_PROST|nr:50S ribosome-binding GTPase [Providencia stuartii]